MWSCPKIHISQTLCHICFMNSITLMKLIILMHNVSSIMLNIRRDSGRADSFYKIGIIDILKYSDLTIYK